MGKNEKMSVLKNDLAGQFVRVLAPAWRAGDIAQVLNHPADPAYYIHNPSYGIHALREEFEVIDEPEPRPRWAYPDWHHLAGGNDVEPEPVYGTGFTYYPGTDSWYFTVQDAEVCRTEALGDRTVNVDYGTGGGVVGIEIL